MNISVLSLAFSVNFPGMPSILHEVLIGLFRERKAMAFELLEKVFELKLPSYAQIEVREARLTQIVPAEYEADLVLELTNLGGKPVFSVAVEAQLARDDRKVFSWPLYAMAARARSRCPTVVLVVTPSVSVARWASRPIKIGPGSSAFGTGSCCGSEGDEPSGGGSGAGVGGAFGAFPWAGAGGRWGGHGRNCRDFWPRRGACEVVL